MAKNLAAARHQHNRAWHFIPLDRLADQSESRLERVSECRAMLVRSRGKNPGTVRECEGSNKADLEKNGHAHKKTESGNSGKVNKCKSVNECANDKGVGNATNAWPTVHLTDGITVQQDHSPSGPHLPGTVAVSQTHAMSSPRMVPVAEANLSVSRPMRCNVETKRFGSG